MNVPGLGIQCPPWLVATVTAAASLIGAGIFVGTNLNQATRERQEINFRLCRMERVMHIEPWISCPTVTGNQTQQGATP